MPSLAALPPPLPRKSRLVPLFSPLGGLNAISLQGVPAGATPKPLWNQDSHTKCEALQLQVQLEALEKPDP